ncbi:tape measure protein [Corynebacteriaceae bacterium 7-707]
MAELGVGYISVIPETSKITPGIKKAFGEADAEAGKSGEKGGQSFGQKFTSTATNALKKGGLAAGAAAGAGIAVGVTKGIGRLNAIEQAESKLSGLGNSGKQVGSIMEDALSAVKGTAYGLGDAATVAAAAVAAGVEPGQDLERTLKLVGDAAAIAGTDLSEMGSIFNKVATSGKVQGDVLNQLSDQGIPIVQLLAEEMGVAAEEVYKLGRDGEINFDIFRNAIEKGMGGAALEAGNTAQGALANVGAAAGRLGATLAGPFFEQSKGAFGGITDLLDDLNDRAAPAMQEFSDWLTGTGIPAVQDFASEAVDSFQSLASNPALQSALSSTQIAIGKTLDAGKALAPVILDVGKTVGEAAAAVGVSSWDLLATGLGAAATVAESLAGPLQTVADLMSAHPAIVTAGIAAWAGFKTIPRMLTGVATGIAGVTGASRALEGVSNPIRKIGTALSPIREQAVLVGSSVREAGVQVRTFADHQPGVSRMSAAMQALGNNVPVIQKMTSAYAASSAGLKTYATQQQIAGRMASTAALQSKDLFTVVDRMGASSFRTASGAVASFAGTVKGIGAASLTGMKTAASGVMNLMGGPWGAALAVGAGAVMMVADWQSKWNTYLKESENLTRISSRSYKSMFDTIVNGASKLDTTTAQIEDLRDSLTKVGQSDPGGISRWFKEMQLNVEEAGNAIRTDAAKTSTAQERAWLDTADAAEKAVAAMDRLGLSNEEIARQVNGSSEQFVKFKNELRESGEGGQELAQHMQDLRDANTKAAESAERLGPSAANAAQVISDLGSKASTSADDVVRLHDAIYGLSDGAQDAGDAAGDLTEKIDEASRAAYDFGDVTLDTNGRIDQSTMAGKEFSDALSNLTDGYLNSVAAGNNAGDEFGRIEEQLYRMGEAAGLNRGEMDDLLTTMGLMPNQVQTTVSVAGDTAKSELAVIGRTLQDLGEGEHTAEISVTDEQAKKALEDAGFKLEKWNEETGVGTLRVDDAQAIDRFTWWTENGFPEIDTAEPTAKANLDTTGLGFNAHWAMMQVDTLDMARPSPLADMNIDDLTERQIEALEKIGLLADGKPTPRAFLNMDEFNRSEQILLAQIFDLSKERAVPVAELLGLTEFKNDTDAAKRYLDSIPNEKTVTVNWAQGFVTVKDPTALKDSDSYFPVAPNPQDAFNRASGRADGGRIPRSAVGRRIGSRSGYRLPTSGPGTDRTDGILGVSRDGTPTSWVDAGEWVVNAKSADKYHNLLEAINDDDVSAIQAAVDTALPANAAGGRVGDVTGAANLTMGMDLEGVLAEKGQGGPFDGLLQSWQTMATTMADTSTSLVAPTMSGMQQDVANLGTAFTTAAQTVVNPSVLSMGQNLTDVRATLVDPALAGVRAGVDQTAATFSGAVHGRMNPDWSNMGAHLQAVKDGSVLPTFGGIQGGIDTLAGWFSTGVGHMGSAFNRLKPGTGVPGAFVVREVFNNGIRNAWNAISELIDEKQMGPVPMGALGAYKTGGVLPGYTPGRDVHQFSSPTGGRLMLSGGEAIMRPEWTRAVGGPRAVDEMNAAARSGKLARGTDEHAHANGGVLAFADGGVLAKNPGVSITTPIQRSMERAVAKAFPNQIITSGTRYADVGSGFDNHMAGRALDFAPSQALANWIKATYPHSAELFWDPGPNIKNGSPTGAIGGHSDHVHWAMSSIVDPYSGKVVSMSGPGDGAGAVSITDTVKGMWDDEVEKTPKWKGGHGMFGAAVPKLQEAMESRAWEYVKEQADKIMAGPAVPGGAGVDRWRPMVRKAFAFQNEPFVEDHFERLMQQMANESNGDPNVMQHGYVDVNTGGNEAVGLFQFAKSTWPEYRDPRLSDDRRDPWANINAGVRYARDRHGWGPIVGSPGGWKDGGVLPSNLPAALFDTGGVLEPDSVAVNRSGKPEPVLNNSQWMDVSSTVGELRKLVPAIVELEPALNQVAADFERFVDANPQVQRAIEIGNEAAAEFAEKHPDVLAEVAQGVGDDLLDFFGAGGAWYTDLSKLDISWDTPAPDENDKDKTEKVELDNAKTMSLVIENLNTMDPNAAARAVAREGRRLLAAF